MKTKKLFSLTLICMLLVSIIFSGTDVSAKSKMALKVTYKGKTLTLVDNFKENSFGRSSNVTFKKCEKAWGKPKKKKSSDVGNTTNYTWKTKKTEIVLNDYDAPAGVVGGIYVSINDKNGALAGIKVGMTKAKALQKLKKTFGSSKVSVSNEYISLNLYGIMTSFQLDSKGKIKSMLVSRS